MNVTFIPLKTNSGVKNWAAMEVKEETQTDIILWVGNNDDPYYNYKFKISGTKAEIDIVKELSMKIEEA